MTAFTSAQRSDEKLREQLQTLCELHNAIKGNAADYDCPVCRNKGVVYKLNGMQQVAQFCECLPIRERIRRMKHSGLYEKIRSSTFASFRADEPWQRHILDTAKRYAEKHDRPAFFIGGQTGCGKTHLCTAICGELLRQGFDVQYFVWETYVKEILSRSGNSDRDEREKLMQPLYSSDTVYLDDFLRKDNPTQAERSVAFDVINHRYTEGKMTIVSSEHVMQKLHCVDGAIAGRITEMCGSEYCLNIDPDIRKDNRMRQHKSESAVI